jgi:predicted PhzF superfamily epimerase YddE/YHI9
MTVLHIVRVFLGPDGRGGNPLGVFLDGPSIPEQDRQPIAAELGFSETVWVDAVEGRRATIRIHTPTIEMVFAGHPTVGTSWLLRETDRPVDVLQVPAGDVATGSDGDRTWIRARAAWANGLIEPHQFATPAEVDALQPGRMGEPGLYAWAWEDEAAGRVRVRFFATNVGILEDEATGLGAVVMGDLLGRSLTIRQGVGSEILVVPHPETGFVDIGGRVMPMEIREYDASPHTSRSDP